MFAQFHQQVKEDCFEYFRIDTEKAYTSVVVTVLCLFPCASGKLIPEVRRLSSIRPKWIWKEVGESVPCSCHHFCTFHIWSHLQLCPHHPFRLEVLALFNLPKGFVCCPGLPFRTPIPNALTDEVMPSLNNSRFVTIQLFWLNWEKLSRNSRVLERL